MAMVARFVALVMGAVFGWVFLTQPLWLAELAGIACLVVVLRWDRLAATALFGGIGAAFVVVGAPDVTTGRTDWWLAGLSILALAATAVIGAGKRWADDPRRVGARKRIVAAFVLGSLALGLIGLPMRPGERAVPAGGWSPEWLGFGCAGVGLDAVVRGDAQDPKVVWLESQLSGPEVPAGQRVDVVWPFGYRARFTPNLELLDSWGNVVLRAGDRVSESCGGVGEDNLLHMKPPFN